MLALMIAPSLFSDAVHLERSHKIDYHWVKSVRIRSYSGPYFPAFGLSTDQNNSESGRFSYSVRATRTLNNI